MSTHRFYVRDGVAAQSLSSSEVSQLPRSPQSQLSSEVTVPTWVIPLLVVMVAGLLRASYRTWQTAMYRHYACRLERLWHSSLVD